MHSNDLSSLTTGATSIRVIGPTPDIKDPVLIGFTLYTTHVDVTSGSANAAASVSFQDGDTGIDYAAIDFSPPSGNKMKQSCTFHPNDLVSGGSLTKGTLEKDPPKLEIQRGLHLLFILCMSIFIAIFI